MNLSGPIIIIEDNLDDQELLDRAFNIVNPGNNVIYFRDSLAAYEWIKTPVERPFLIISDIYLPKLTGLELRDKLLEDPILRLQNIPFLFFTTTQCSTTIMDAYSQHAQGFFHKPMEMESLAKMLATIIDYWKLSK